MLGSRCLKKWSKTQVTIAMSSAESEMYAADKGACEALGCKTLLSEFGVQANIRLHLDGSAAKGILERVGLQKMRRLVCVLWMHHQSAREIIDIREVVGESSGADRMTKGVAQAKMCKLLKLIGACCQ